MSTGAWFLHSRHFGKANDVVRIHIKVIIRQQAQLQPFVSSKCGKCIYGYVAADQRSEMQTNSCPCGLGLALFSGLPLECAKSKFAAAADCFPSDSQCRSRCWCKLTHICELCCAHKLVSKNNSMQIQNVRSRSDDISDLLHLRPRALLPQQNIRMQAHTCRNSI